MAVSLPSINGALAYFAPVTDMGRAMDVLNAFPVLRPEERLAASTVLDLFAAEQFAPETPETQAWQNLVGTVRNSNGEHHEPITWTAARELWSLVAPPASGVFPIGQYATKKPHFHIGPVPVYQSDRLSGIWQINETPAVLQGEGGYLRLQSNEPNFPVFYPHVAGLGGVVFGVGTFQNFNLAVASTASGLILADLSPVVSVAMALLVSQLPKQASRYDFAETALRLVRRGETKEQFLEEVTAEYRPVVSFMIDQMRELGQERAIRRYFTRALQDPSEAFSSDEHYEFLADLARTGATAVIHGNVFEADMPDLVGSALSVHDDPLRTVYLSNAPEWIRSENQPTPLRSLSSLFESPQTDPEGVLLTSTEYGRTDEARAQKRSMNDQFSYHALPMGTAARLLRAYGRVTRFVDRLQHQVGLTFPQIGSTP